jgi:transposase
VTDERWQVLRKHLPPPVRLGRPPIDRRLIVNAVPYLNRTGCQWRALPHDFPKWKTVYASFSENSSPPPRRPRPGDRMPTVEDKTVAKLDAKTTK